MESTDFRSPTVKEAKQAELLVHGSFPWDLVEAVGVISDGVRRQAEAAIAASTHQPAVIVRRQPDSGVALFGSLLRDPEPRTEDDTE